MPLVKRHEIAKRHVLFALILVSALAFVRPAALLAGEAEDTIRLQKAARTATPEEFREVLAGIKHPSGRTLGAALLAAFDGSNYDAIVPMLLDAGANPAFGEDLDNGAVSKAVTRRIEAKKHNSLATVRLLLKHGSAPDAVDEMGYSLLMKATSADDLELAEVLIAFHANPRFKNKDGLTALDMADDESMRSILEKGENKRLGLWGDPSVAAVRFLNPPGADQGKFVEPRTIQETVEQNRQIMLHALSMNDIQQLNEILNDSRRSRNGFHPDMDLEDGLRPLMVVQSAEAARILLYHGASPNLVDIKGRTALHHAMMSQRPAEIVTILLSAGADVNIRDSWADIPLNLLRIVFIEFQNPSTGEQLLRKLVKAGSNINSRDERGDTLLHVAANNDNAALASAVLVLGADPNAVNNSGDTPLAIAERLNSNSIIGLLKKK